MEALPNEILREIGDYLMPDPLTIHMLLREDRLDFDVCGESMESGSPNAVLLAKKRYVEDLHCFGKTCRAAQNIRDLIFSRRLKVCFFDTHTITCVLDTQNLQPFRSVEVIFKCINEPSSILPSLCQLSKFTQLACLKVHFSVPRTIASSRLQEFKQDVRQAFSPSVKLDIEIRVHPVAMKFFIKPAHWCNQKCREYYSPGKAQPGMLIRIIPSDDYLAAGVVLSVKDFAAGVIPSVEDLTAPQVLPAMKDIMATVLTRRPRRRSRVGP